MEKKGIKRIKRATRCIGGLSLKAGAGTTMAVQVAYNNLMSIDRLIERGKEYERIISNRTGIKRDPRGR